MSLPLPSSLRILRSLAELKAAAWDGLCDDDASPFLRHDWLSALERSGCVAPDTGWDPRHLTLFQGNRLVAAAPAYLRTDSDGEFVDDSGWQLGASRLGHDYYPRLLLTVPFTPVTGRRVLVAPGEDRALRTAQLLQAAIAWARHEKLSSVHVHFHRADEAEAMEAAGFALRFGLQYRFHNEGFRTFDDFLARFRSKRRTQVERERRAVADAGITFHTTTGDALTPDAADALFSLYESTVERNDGAQLFNLAFFRELFASPFRAHIEVLEARKGTRAVAAAFNVRGHDALYGRTWGTHEAIPFLHFATCLYEPVAQCIAQGLSRFEPGAGGEHKLVRGCLPVPTFSSHVHFEPRLDRAVRGFLTAEAAALTQGLPSWQKDSGLKAPYPAPEWPTRRM